MTTLLPNYPFKIVAYTLQNYLSLLFSKVLYCPFIRLFVPFAEVTTLTGGDDVNSNIPWIRLVEFIARRNRDMVLLVKKVRSIPQLGRISTISARTIEILKRTPPIFDSKSSRQFLGAIKASLPISLQSFWVNLSTPAPLFIYCFSVLCVIAPLYLVPFGWIVFLPPAHIVSVNYFGLLRMIIAPALTFVARRLGIVRFVSRPNAFATQAEMLDAISALFVFAQLVTWLPNATLTANTSDWRGIVDHSILVNAISHSGCDQSGTSAASSCSYSLGHWGYCTL